MLHPATLPLLRSGRVVVALSGGRDSVALLLLLHEGGYELAACHVHHGIRGSAADADARFCRELCDSLSIPLELTHVDVPALAAAQHQSIETAARSARRAALAGAAAHFSCSMVALAHHADDQAETVLFRLARGAAGPRGMQPVQRTQGIIWLRPLLGLRRAELTDYLQRRAQSWVEDATNAGTDAVRNRLRHEVLPALNRAMERDCTPILCRSAAVQAEVNEALEGALSRLPLCDPQGRLYLPALEGAEPALTRAVLHRYLTRAGVPNISADAVASLANILAPDAPVSRMNLSGNYHACRRHRRLEIFDARGAPVRVSWGKAAGSVVNQGGDDVR